MMRRGPGHWPGGMRSAMGHLTCAHSRLTSMAGGMEWRGCYIPPTPTSVHPGVKWGAGEELAQENVAQQSVHGSWWMGYCSMHTHTCTRTVAYCAANNIKCSSVA